MNRPNRLPRSIWLELFAGAFLLVTGVVFFSIRLADYGFNPIAIVAFWLLVPLTAWLLFRVVMTNETETEDV